MLILFAIERALNGSLVIDGGDRSLLRRLSASSCPENKHRVSLRMAATAAADPTALYRLASNWESVPDADRAPLRTLVERLVGYPCKIAAMPLNDGAMHLIVFSVEANAVKDYLELQPTGAMGVVFHLYDDPDSPVVWRISDACDDYNDSHGVEFESDSESDSGSDSDSVDESAEKSKKA
jgi:hypothetical protein